MKRIFKTLALLVAFAISANAALACSVCATGKEESRGAYYATTAAMSLIPLGMLGGVVYYVAKKSR